MKSILLLASTVVFVSGMSRILQAAANAEGLYEVNRGRGVVTITNAKPEGNISYRSIGIKSARFSKIYVAPGRTQTKTKARNTEFDLLIDAIATDYQIEPALARSVVHVESAFNPYAYSPKGAMGLMQLMPATARRFGVRNVWEPQENIEGGVKYLRWLLDRYNGNHRLALAAYNAGEGAVDQYREIPPYSETVDYVRKVLDVLSVYRGIVTVKRELSPNIDSFHE